MRMYQQGYIKQDGVDWSANPAPLTADQVINYLVAKGSDEENARWVISNACDAHKRGSVDGVPMTPFLRLRVVP